MTSLWIIKNENMQTNGLMKLRSAMAISLNPHEQEFASDNIAHLKRDRQQWEEVIAHYIRGIFE